ncbi:hypothetical protein OIY81_2873 [Cryptosporidium canis]|nr:hypothetical protein OIY81_2873 [Cryptosporidium canis]
MRGVDGGWWRREKGGGGRYFFSSSFLSRDIYLDGGSSCSFYLVELYGQELVVSSEPEMQLAWLKFTDLMGNHWVAVNWRVFALDWVVPVSCWDVWGGPIAMWYLEFHGQK